MKPIFVLPVISMWSVSAVANPVASPVAEADRAYAVDVAPVAARGKEMPTTGKPELRKYTDVAGLYTFTLPTGWRMEVVQDEPPGRAFKGIHNQHPVNCVVYGKDYRRPPKKVMPPVSTI
jgi:hypothetical protein